MNARVLPMVAIADLVEQVRTWNPATKPDETFDYVDLSAVSQTEKRILASTPTQGADAPSRARQVIREGDVLVSTVRPNLNGVAPVTYDFDGATASTGFCVLRPRRQKLASAYLMHWVRSPQFVDSMVRQATGASYPAVSDKIVKASAIPLPALDEQRRIATILDKADALRRKRKHVLELLDGLTVSAFSAAFGGNEAPPVNGRSKLPALPLGWEWALLKSVGRLATGHTPDRKRPEYWSGAIPWISLTDIRRLNGSAAMFTEEYVTQAGIDNSSSVVLPEGTVCLSRTASVGFVTIMGRAMATSQDFVNWVCGPRILPEYLMWALIASRRELVSLAPGSIHKTIYFPTVESLKVLIPPLYLQSKFVKQAQSIARYSTMLKPSIDELDKLFCSLQHRAFSGRL